MVILSALHSELWQKHVTCELTDIIKPHLPLVLNGDLFIFRNKADYLWCMWIIWFLEKLLAFLYHNFSDFIYFYFLRFRLLNNWSIKKQFLLVSFSVSLSVSLETDCWVSHGHTWYFTHIDRKCSRWLSRLVSDGNRTRPSLLEAYL